MAVSVPHNHTKNRAHRSGGGGSVSGSAGGREDCWGDDATETLIEAWGDRYIRLNRGNLRQKDWKEVADAVNARQNGVTPRRTDAQCKNRIDTLKKKYKQEKARPSPSKWPFYKRLDSLIGAATVASLKPSTVTATVKSSKPKSFGNAIREIYPAGASRLNSGGVGSTESSLGLGDDDGGNEDKEDDGLGVYQNVGTKHRIESVGFTEGAACRELARAILKFGEIYERIESSKQQQMMELEKQRMEFTKDLEYQRMNIFMDAQLELEKIKRPKQCASGSGKNQ